MPRRSSGEGSISHRQDGRWQGALQIASRRVTVYGKTRSEVAEKLRRLSEGAARAGSRLPTATKLTLGAYLAEWLEQAKPRLRPSTAKDYDVIIRCHVGGLAKTPLAKLHPLQLARHYAGLSKTLSPRRVEMVHRLLHKALGDALRWGLLATNPAALVESPRPEAKEVALWQMDELGRFAAAVLEGKAGQYGYLFGFLLASGCREGEAFGLRWGDVDWATASVRIERQITWVKNRTHELPPKTRSGRRTVTLPGWGIEVLRRQRALQAEQRLRASTWLGGERVFTTETGSVPSPTNLRRSLHALCDRLGLPRLRVHDLRHLHLSLLAMNGVPLKVAQARAGHSSPTVTLKVYQHVLGDGDRAAAEAIGRALAR